MRISRAGAFTLSVAAAAATALLLSADFHRTDPSLEPLVASADLIVLADVLEVYEWPHPDHARHRVARLLVRESWKGEAPRRLEVPFRDTPASPEPPRYREGELVVAFLRRDAGGWGTLGMASGTRYPEGERLQSMREEVLSLAGMPTPAEPAIF